MYYRSLLRFENGSFGFYHVSAPEFPTFLEEVLVNNTKELITGGKPIFERMNVSLSPRIARFRLSQFRHPRLHDLPTIALQCIG